MTHGEPRMYDLSEAESLDDFAEALDALRDAQRDAFQARLGQGSSRVNADEQNVEQGLAQLVLSLVELLRQLLEKQALRRMEAGTLDDEEIERLGTTFMKLEERMDLLRETFGLDEEDLNIDLGPLGTLVEDRTVNHKR